MTNKDGDHFPEQLVRAGAVAPPTRQVLDDAHRAMREEANQTLRVG